MLVKCGLQMSRIATPTDPVLPVIMLRATGLEWYLRSSIAACTRRSTVAVKRCVELMNFDTVAIDTPAWAATSRIVGLRFISKCFPDWDGTGRSLPRLDKGICRQQNSGKRFPLYGPPPHF